MTRGPDRTSTGPAGGVPARTEALPGAGSMDPSQVEGHQPPAVVLGAVALAVGFTALITPKGPGRIGPVDALVLLAVFVVLVWVLRTRTPVRMPYVVPMAGLMIAGLVAAVFGQVPARGALAVFQEVFLLIWCATIATVCVSGRAVGLLLRVWALSVTAWAGLMIIGVFTGVTAISGVGSRVVPKSSLGGRFSDGTRARLFFDHPNMAGNFFMAAIFIVVAGRYPRRRSARIAVIAVLLSALFLTGSNAALLSLVAGSVVTVFLHIRAHGGLAKATAVSAVVVTLLGVGWVSVAAPLVEAAQQSENEVLKYSVGRGERSAGLRQELFESQFTLFEKDYLLGIGPASTRVALSDSDARAVKEAHNDYLATLVERGPLGSLALAGLIGVIWIRLARITRRTLPPRLGEAVPVPAALAGACAAFAVTALTHEILHYRWFWALLGIVAAVHLLERAESGAEPTGSAALGSTGAPPGSSLARAVPRAH